METKSDDGGDPLPVKSACLIFLSLIFLAACHKQANTFQKVRKDKLVLNADAKTAYTIKRKSHKKKLYLTFDDGPNKGTRNVLHIVQDEAVPVSFFIVGQHVFASAFQHETWDSLQIANHIDLCNHSFCHANNHYQKYYRDADSVVRDFELTEDTLKLTNSIVRTPGRNIWRIDTLQFTDLKKSAAAADSLQKAGFIVMGWDLEWHFDPKTMSVVTSPDDLLNQIDSAFTHSKTKQKDHLVLLAHDQVYQKPDDSIKLRQFLQKLKQKDEYELSLVTAYPGASLPDTFKVKDISQ